MSGNSDFLMALGRIDNGSLVESADEFTRQCATEVNRYGGKATLTLTLTFQPNGQPGGGALKVSGGVKSTMPKRPQGESFYWVGEDGELQRTPPKDHNLLEGPRAVEITPPKRY